MKYLVWCPEYEETEEMATVVATEPPFVSPRDAVERWARDHDQYWDYHIIRGNDVVVHVQPLADYRPITRWKVHGETVPEYHARPVPEGT